MKNICLCFQIHHPFHYQIFRFLDQGSSRSYYDDLRIEREINEAATNYYLPTNEFLLKLINQFRKKLKVAFYISGTAIDQFLMYEPDVLTSFRQLADTGQVEFLGGTKSHSLISLSDQKSEFQHQLKHYRSKIESLFGKQPLVFVNSDMIYSDQIGKDVAEAGYRAMITNGSKKTLKWQSPNYVYSNCFQPNMNVYFRNEQASNEIVNQLNNLNSDDKNIETNSIFSLINNQNYEEPLSNIYLDYKTLGGFGMNRKQEFIRKLVSQINRSSNMNFTFPSEIVELCGSVAEINSEEPICLVNNFHSYYYPGNDLQVEAIRQLYKLKEMMDHIDNLNLQKDWEYLQTSDHIHLMDDQHPIYQDNSNSFCVYKSKYDAFINYMNILSDFRLKIKETIRKRKKTQLKQSEQIKNGKQTYPIPISKSHKTKIKNQSIFFG